jgi:hypothetical protein
VRDDVLDRIQRAIDAGAVVDDELEREFASDPEAMRLASELVAIDEALRSWPEPRVSDETLDAIALRVEQRLDERLAPIGDPTAAPVFDDEEAIAISIAPPVSRAPDVAELRQLATPRHSAETLPPDLLESIPPEAPADLVASIARMPARTDERFELPSVRPQAVVVPIARRSERAPEAAPPKKSGAPVIWLLGGTLAAAAAALLVVAVGTFGTTRSEVALSEPGAATSESPERTLTPTVPAPPPSAMPIGAGGGGPDTMLAREELTGEAEFDEGAAANEALALDLADAAEPPADEAQAQGSPARTVETSSTDRRARSAATADEQRRGGSAGSPTREQILTAMRAIAPAVSACGGGARTGVAEVRVRLGSSGRVQSAVVIGQFAGTPEGTCIARAVRGARVPPFRQASFDFTYPFRIN